MVALSVHLVMIFQFFRLCPPSPSSCPDILQPCRRTQRLPPASRQLDSSHQLCNRTLPLCPHLAEGRRIYLRTPRLGGKESQEMSQWVYLGTLGYGQIAAIRRARGHLDRVIGELHWGQMESIPIIMRFGFGFSTNFFTSS